jgi:hypothetical protein
MPSDPRRHPVREAARGIALTAGIAVVIVAVATVIAAVAVLAAR